MLYAHCDTGGLQRLPMNATTGTPQSNAPVTFTAESCCLLNRNLAPHAHREVWCANEVVLARRNVRERYGNLVTDVHVHAAGQERQLVRHVRVELRSGTGRNGVFLEGNVMRWSAHHDEANAIAGSDGEFSGIIAIALIVAEHAYFMRGAGDWSSSNATLGTGARGGRRRGGRSCSGVVCRGATTAARRN